MKTVRSSLNEFRKYYLSFLQLNAKESTDHLPYPFNASRETVDEETHKEYILFSQILNMHTSLYSPEAANYVFQNVIMGKENGTWHKIAVFMFFCSKPFEKGTTPPHSRLFYYNNLVKQINRRMHWFLRELDTVEFLDWTPNE